MAEVEIDDGLVEGLTQAKKKPRNFVMLAKGPKPLKLIVERKAIKAQVIKDAKQEHKANVVVHGVCQGEGPVMIFFVTEDPGFKTVAVRELISEQTELTLKVEFRVVPQLPDVPSEEGPLEGDATKPTGETAPGPQSTSTETPSPSTTTQPPATAAAQLLAALNKLTPSIKTAVLVDPARKAELLGAVAAFQALVKDEAKATEARAKLLEIGKLAQSMNTSKATGSGTTGGSTTSEESEVETESEDEVRNTDADDDRDLFETTFLLLESRYLAVMRSKPSTAAQLRTVLDFANGKAEQGNYAAGVTSLERLEDMIDAAEAEIAARTADAFIDEVDEARGVVAFRKALYLWSFAVDSVRTAIQDVRTAVLAEFPDTNVDRLDDVLSTLEERGSLSNALTDCVNAEQDEQREYRDAALELAEDYTAIVESSESIKEIDRNGFVSVAIGKTLSKALEQLTAELRK